MLELFYAPHACSISPHVALLEAGVPFKLTRVDFMSGKKLPDGTSFNDVNPKGYVPALRLENGEILTEGAVMAQYIADLAPEKKLMPAAGTLERYRAQEWLNFIATELHKGLGPLFAKNVNDEFKKAAKEKLASRFAFVAKHLEGKQFLVGDHFTVADGYLLYNIRTWNRVVKEPLSPVLVEYAARIAARPSVKAALEAEGIT